MLSLQSGLCEQTIYFLKFNLGREEELTEHAMFWNNRKISNIHHALVRKYNRVGNKQNINNKPVILECIAFLNVLSYIMKGIS